MPTHPARRRFCNLLKQPDEQIDLAEAALCIAWEDRGSGDPNAALALIDRIAAGCRQRLADLNHPQSIITTLNAYFFDDLGFRGNTWSYGEPENSFLDQALETRVGLPIILSIIYIEVARRLNLPIAGAALPGHFIVCYSTNQEQIFIDPFHRGRIWSYSECEAQARLFYGTVAPELMREILAPPSARTVLARILRNLKGAYLERDDVPHALSAVERILLVEGNTPTELRDRGLLNARLGHLHRALDDLDAYARLGTNATDRESVRRHARSLIERIGHSS